MQVLQNLNLKDILVGFLVIGMISYSGYLGYGIFFQDSSDDVTTLNAGILGPKLQKVALILNSSKDKISFKQRDLSYTEGSLYKSFTDLPEAVPLSEERGRRDPFVPYVAP